MPLEHFYFQHCFTSCGMLLFRICKLDGSCFIELISKNFNCSIFDLKNDDWLHS